MKKIIFTKLTISETHHISAGNRNKRVKNLFIPGNSLGGLTPPPESDDWNDDPNGPNGVACGGEKPTREC